MIQYRITDHVDKRQVLARAEGEYRDIVFVFEYQPFFCHFEWSDAQERIIEHTKDTIDEVYNILKGHIGNPSKDIVSDIERYIDSIIDTSFRFDNKSEVMWGR